MGGRPPTKKIFPPQFFVAFLLKSKLKTLLSKSTPLSQVPLEAFSGVAAGKQYRLLPIIQ